eukprot:6213351-Pleurochrysis_carterae.AAC.1
MCGGGGGPARTWPRAARAQSRSVACSGSAGTAASPNGAPAHTRARRRAWSKQCAQTHSEEGASSEEAGQ